jgi:hypothetical protein
MSVGVAASLCAAITPSASVASSVQVKVGPRDEGPWAGVEYRAEPQETNRVVLVTVDDQTVDVSDSGAVILPGRGCRSLDAHTARCSTANTGRQGLIGSSVSLGDMDDAAESRGPGLTAHGGPGNDVLQSSSIVAGDLNGGGGRDTLLGGRNMDTLSDGDTSGAADSDVLDGREGGAVLSYAGRTAAVRVDLSGPGGGAGEAGEADVISSITAVRGGAGSDTLLGRSVEGGAGADRIVGTGGDDFLMGGLGSDHISGGRGQDSLIGGPGADQLSGGNGADFLDGGRGRDRLAGGRGDDILRSGLARCGAGADSVGPSAYDYVDGDCEVTTFGLPTRYADAKGVRLTRYPRVSRRTSVVFSVQCPSEETDGYPSPVVLRGRVRLSGPGGLFVGGGAIPSAGARCPASEAENSSELAVVKVRAVLSPAARRLLARGGSAVVTVAFRGRNVPPLPWRVRLRV